MKINLKVILPILVLLAIVLCAFGYLLYYLNRQGNTISFESIEYQRLNFLSQELAKQQEITEFSLLVYILTQNPESLNAIAEADIEKANAIDKVYPYVTDDNTKKIIANYLKARSDINLVRQNLVDAVNSRNRNQIQQSYNAWKNKTEEIHKALTQIEGINNQALSGILDYFKDTSNKLLEIILILFLTVILSLFFIFYYLRSTITTPIIKLSNYVEDITNKNFLGIADDNMKRNDEIGGLYNTFNKMSRRIRDYYKTLETSVQERTKELTSRTKELEDTQQATLNILEDLRFERQKLEENRALDEAILASIGDALVVVDKTGLITYVNEAYEKITGWKKDEVYGKPLVEVLPAYTEKNGKFIRTDPNKRFTTSILNDQNPEYDFVTTVYYERKNGEKFPITSLVNRVLMNNKVVGAVKTFNDVTKAKQIDKAKTEFVSLAAHQLRTPLSTISWYTEMLLSGDAGELSENQKNYLNQIYTGNERMINMVKSFLNASRIDLGTLQFEKEPTDMLDLLKSVIEEQNPRLEKKALALELESEADLPAVETDPKRIRMVLQNLLSNALKYSNEKEKIEVSVKYEKESNSLLIKFVDHGYGIPEEAKSKIFSKLYRAENVVERATDGTGLGLYIAKNIVDQSGGKIWFESVLDQGTTFYLSLPIKK